MAKEANSQEKQQQSKRRSELDDRYGKIGISAVAGAVCHHKEEPRRRTETDKRFTPSDCD